jgi:hypothetical protein
MMRPLLKNILTAGLLMVLCAGCSFRSDLETRFAVKAVPEKICRIAVLPYENRTRNPEAGTMAYRIFYSELLASGALELEAEGDVRLFMLRNRLLPGQLLTASHYADMVERLEVDAVITGLVSEVGMDSRKAGEDVPFVAMQLDMYDARNGDRILSSFHRRWGDDYRKAMHFGMVKTVTGVMSHLSREVVNDWIEKGVGDCR